jgi:hypothetical protein
MFSEAIGLSKILLLLCLLKLMKLAYLQLLTHAPKKITVTIIDPIMRTLRDLRR